MVCAEGLASQLGIGHLPIPKAIFFFFFFFFFVVVVPSLICYLSPSGSCQAVPGFITSSSLCFLPCPSLTQCLGRLKEKAFISLAERLVEN
jgi:hypothetical protein